jgi:hypothetical protein
MRREQPTRPKRKAASKAPKPERSSGNSADAGPNEKPTDDTDDLNIVPDEFMPEWNYTILPRHKK